MRRSRRPHGLTSMREPKPIDDKAIYAIERPDRKLFTYYILASFLAGPGMPFVLVYSYFRYHTMRYRFDEEGVSMSWGILFRREINLTYARIQDIHLASNLVERYLGLARILVQTASGSSGAEMTIEGVLEYEMLRDFLYSRMRGTRHLPESRAKTVAQIGEADLADVLREVASELRAVREALESERGEVRDA